MATKTKQELKDEIAKNLLTKQLLIDMTDSLGEEQFNLLIANAYNVSLSSGESNTVFFGDANGFAVTTYSSVEIIEIPYFSSEGFLQLQSSKELRPGDTLIINDSENFTTNMFNVIGCLIDNNKYICEVESIVSSGGIGSAIKINYKPTGRDYDYYVSTWDQLTDVASNHLLNNNHTVFVAKIIEVNITDANNKEMFINSAAINVFGHKIKFTKFISATGNVVFSSNTTGSISQRMPIKFHNIISFKNLNSGSPLDIIMNENDAVSGNLEYYFTRLEDEQNEAVRIRMDNNPNLVLKYEYTNISDLTDVGYETPIKEFWLNSIGDKFNYDYGKYTPTAVNVSNAVSVSNSEFKWTRQGDFVEVDGRVQFGSSYIDTVIVSIPLPIASNFTTDDDCTGGATSLQSITPIIVADTTGNTALIKVYPTATDVTDYYFKFKYEVK